MTPHIEDLVRDAQERFADRAVHPERIRAGLPRRAARRARRRRYGALGVAGIAVAVAAAVVAPVLALGHGSGGAKAPGFAAPRQSAPGGPPAATELAPALRYRPGWLPAGLRERIRWVPLTGEAGASSPAMRTWTAQPVGTNGHGANSTLILSIRPSSAANDPQRNDGVAVDINGQRGYYHGRPGEEKSYVEWRAGATVLSVSQLRLGLSEADLVKVARSVRPDTGRLRVPLELGWLPSGMSAGFAEVSGDSPTSWYVSVTAEEPQPQAGKESKEGPRNISVELSPTTNAPSGGERLTVNGRPARLVTRTDIPGLNMKYLVVDLGGGQLLTVTASWPTARPLTRADMVKVAERASPVTPADVAWIGTR
jgi:hypothetical protein